VQKQWYLWRKEMERHDRWIEKLLDRLTRLEDENKFLLFRIDEQNREIAKLNKRHIHVWTDGKCTCGMLENLTSCLLAIARGESTTKTARRIEEIWQQKENKND